VFPSMAAPRYARLFVALFLAAIVLCAAVPLNPWPFSNWELFSRLRTDRRIVWEEVALTSTGREHDYLLSRLPRGYGVASCGSWIANASAKLGSDTQAVEVYRLQLLLTHRRGRRAAPPRRTLELACDSKGTRAGS
jgi:hypothetical protein